MKQRRCKLEDGYIPTFEEIAENKRTIEICRHYGIRIGYLSSKELLTKDEARALDYILRNKNIPKILQNRLLSTKHLRVQDKNSSNSLNDQITEDKAFKIFGLDTE